MHIRFAALLLALGLADVGYLNLAVAPEVFLRDADADFGLASAEPHTAHAALRESEPRRHMTPEARAPASKAALSTTGRDMPWSQASPSTNASTPGAAGTPAAQGFPRPQTLSEALEPEGAVIVSFPETATATLTPDARDELHQLAARLREHPEQRLRVTGHADARGSSGFNRYLGARRARIVAETLLAAGVRREQIEALSRGEEEPRIAGESEVAWAANRRVEISIGGERSQNR